MEYEEILDMVVTELTQRAFNKQREEDESLRQMIGRRAELSVSLEQWIAALEEPERKLFEEYLEITLEIEGLQERYLYLQGAKDCVRLLKSLDVL